MEDADMKGSTKTLGVHLLSDGAAIELVVTVPDGVQVSVPTTRFSCQVTSTRPGNGWGSKERTMQVMVPVVVKQASTTE